MFQEPELKDSAEFEGLLGLADFKVLRSRLLGLIYTLWHSLDCTLNTKPF